MTQHSTIQDYQLNISSGVCKHGSVPEAANTMLAAVQRDDEVFVPGGDSEIAPGDVVIAIAPERARKELRKIFK